jgi:transcriptional regulator with XRE-family HTH domain
MSRVSFRLQLLLKKLNWSAEDFEKTGLPALSLTPTGRLRWSWWMDQLAAVEYLATVFGVSPAWLAFERGHAAQELTRCSIQNVEPVYRYKQASSRVRQARKKLGLSQRAFALRISSSRYSTGPGPVQKIEGGCIHSIAVIGSLYRALNTTPEWLAFGIGIDGLATDVPPARGRMPERPLMQDQVFEIKARLSRALITLRKKRKLNRRSFADLAGISVAQLAKLEAGGAGVRIDTYIRSYLTMGISIEGLGAIIAGKKWREKKKQRRQESSREGSASACDTSTAAAAPSCP